MFFPLKSRFVSSGSEIVCLMAIFFVEVSVIASCNSSRVETSLSIVIGLTNTQSPVYIPLYSCPLTVAVAVTQTFSFGSFTIPFTVSTVTVRSCCSEKSISPSLLHVQLTSAPSGTASKVNVSSDPSQTEVGFSNVLYAHFTDCETDRTERPDGLGKTYSSPLITTVGCA